MNIYDISLDISPTLPVWPGDPRVILERVSNIDLGDPANVSRIEMGVHTGTHIDAPFHFLGGDSDTVENLPLDVLIGETQVVHLRDNVSMVTAEILQQAEIQSQTTRLLLRTRNSQLWEKNETEFTTNFTAITTDGASYLVDHNIKLIGVDYLSVARYENPEPTHKILLRAGIIIIEGLNLFHVPEGNYDLVCLPLKIPGSDGSPARVVLLDRWYSPRHNSGHR